MNPVDTILTQMISVTTSNVQHYLLRRPLTSVPFGPKLMNLKQIMKNTQTNSRNVGCSTKRSDQQSSKRSRSVDRKVDGALGKVRAGGLGANAAACAVGPGLDRGPERTCMGELVETVRGPVLQ